MTHVFLVFKATSSHTHTRNCYLSMTAVQASFVPFSRPVSFRKMEDIAPLFLNLRDWITGAAAWPTSQTPPFRQKRPWFIANCVWVTVLQQKQARCAPVIACSVLRWVWDAWDGFRFAYRKGCLEWMQMWAVELWHNAPIFGRSLQC